jgi:hypothetical protein
MKRSIVLLAFLAWISLPASAQNSDIGMDPVKWFAGAPLPGVSKAFCTAPIAARIAAQPGTQRVNVVCDATCKDNVKTKLSELVPKLIEVEASSCFDRKFREQATIRLDEAHGKSVDEILLDIRTSRLNDTMTMYFRGITACGKELSDLNTIHTKKSCWADYDDTLKTSYLGHELTQSLSYTHACTTGDITRSPTVPYLTQKVIDYCLMHPDPPSQGATP